MPETLPTSANPAEHRSRRRHVPHRASDAEVLALVERAARVPDGLALLEGAPLECVAVLLGVEPRTVERVRAALEDPALRAEAGRHHLRLAAGRRPGADGAAAAPAPARAPRDPQSLLLAALARDGGVALLLSAAPEAAAVAFGVHPDLVHRAREAMSEPPPHA
jgi:hypothetical protein